MFAYFQAGAGNEEYGSVTGMDKDVVSLGRNLAATLLMSSNDHGAISDADFESSCGVLWMAFGRS